MNSYELDQPLDLRLKALNLSRGLHHDAPLQHQIQPPHSMVMVTNMMMSSYGTGSNSCSNLLLTNYYNQHPNYTNHQPSHNNNNNQQQQQQQQQQQRQQQQQCNDSPLALTTDPATTAAASITTNCSSNILNPPPAYMSQSKLSNPFGGPPQAGIVDTNSQPSVLHHQHQQQHPHPHPHQHQHQHSQQNNTAAHEQVGHQNHLRSDHIHCQPLNHHSPHPLSRLHPSPPSMNHMLPSPPTPQAMQLDSQTPAQGAQQQPPQPAPTRQSLAPLGGAIYGPGISGSASSSDTVSSISPICQNQHQLIHHQHLHHHHQLHHHHHQQQRNQASITSSLQNLAHQNSAIKQRQYSPPIQEQQHQQHQQHAYQPVLPVRSLSMSGQMLTPSHLSLMVSPTSTPPTSTAPLSASCSSSSGNLHFGLSHRMQAGSSTSPSIRTSNESVKSGNQGGGALSRHNTSSSTSSGELGPLNSPFSPSSKSTPSTTSTSCNNNNNNNNGQTSSCPSADQQSSAPIPTPNTSRKGSIHSSVTPPTGSPNFNDTPPGGNGSASPPILRQHSLVSRHSCKPCGIAFSQPETLRAHQEGYCTKTNRNQLRSQSAVSPSALQQTACANSNKNKK